MANYNNFFNNAYSNAKRKAQNPLSSGRNSISPSSQASSPNFGTAGTGGFGSIFGKQVNNYSKPGLRNKFWRGNALRFADAYSQNFTANTPEAIENKVQADQLNTQKQYDQNMANLQMTNARNGMGGQPMEQANLRQMGADLSSSLAQGATNTRQEGAENYVNDLRRAADWFAKGGFQNREQNMEQQRINLAASQFSAQNQKPSGVEGFLGSNLGKMATTGLGGVLGNIAKKAAGGGFNS